jgi:hypothetical protein
MRPLGHDNARVERDDHMPPPDERLQDAWTRHLCYLDWYRPSNFSSAHSSLAALHLSQTTLEEFILRTPIKNADEGEALGVFLSAGYALLPQRTITYALHTPHIHYFGYCLMKNLVITGMLGKSIGTNMVGSLRNHGAIENAGYCMIGSLQNRGSIHSIDESFMGRLEEGGKVTWQHIKGGKRSFLHAITNPRDLSHEDLYVSLMKRYR